jgi:hypothetical protein
MPENKVPRAYYQLCIEKLIDREADPESATIWWSDLYAARESCIDAHCGEKISAVRTALSDYLGITPDITDIQKWIRENLWESFDSPAEHSVCVQIRVHKVADNQ